MANVDTPNPPVNPPAQPAAQYAPPPRRRPRSIAGPFVMITLGLLLLLANFGALSWGSLGVWFAHWWPLLLILWGVIKLVEHNQARNAGYDARGIGFGGWILVIFVALFGITASGVVKHKDDLKAIGINMGGEPHTFEDDMSQPFVAGDSLRVDVGNADVNVRASGSSDDKVHVHVKRVVRSMTQADAQREYDASKPTLTKEGKLIRLESAGGADRGPRIQIGFWDFPSESFEIIVSLPRKADLTIQTRHGDVLVSERDGDIKIDTEHGDLVLNTIAGSVNLSSSHGDTSLNGIKGNVTLEGGKGDVSARDIEGLLSINADRFGDLSAHNISRGIHFTSPNTDLDLGKLEGFLDMDEGDLSAKQISNGFKISTRSKDINLSGVSGDVTISNSHGDVSVRAVAPLGNINIDNQNSDIHLALPENGPFELEADTDNGDITSSFPQVKVTSNDDDRVAKASGAAGAVGSKGPKVRIHTSHADIEIARGTLGGSSADAVDRNADKLSRKADRLAQKLDRKGRDLDRKGQEMDRKAQEIEKKLEDSTKKLDKL
jgi:DUF4097 and DUF4098 domain-containing protein YvlB